MPISQKQISYPNEVTPIMPVYTEYNFLAISTDKIDLSITLKPKINNIQHPTNCT